MEVFILARVMCGDVVEVPKMHRSETGFGPSLITILGQNPSKVKFASKVANSHLQRRQLWQDSAVFGTAAWSGLGCRPLHRIFFPRVSAPSPNPLSRSLVQSPRRFGQHDHHVGCYQRAQGTEAVVAADDASH
jgi:hypothetical protein